MPLYTAGSIADGAVTTAKLADGAVTDVKAASTVVKASEIRVSRNTTGSIAGAGTAAVTITWASAFADANYTVVADVVEAGDDLTVDSVRSQIAASCVIFVRNKDAVNAATGTIHAIAVHDSIVS